MLHAQHGTQSDLSNSIKKISVDDKDLALVNLLRKDARQSYAELGSFVSLSADAVRTRVERLINDELIQLVTLVDPAIVGRQSRVTIGIIHSGSPEAFVAWAKKQQEIVHLTRTLGSFTFCGEVVAESDFYSHQFISEKLRSAPGVIGVESWPMLHIEKWREETRAPVVGADILSQISWSKDDTSILHELTITPRIQFRELAEKVGRPYGIVRRRVLSLFEMGVIRSTVVTNDLFVEHTCMGILLVKGDQRAKQHLLDIPEVTILSSTSGSRQFAGEVSTHSKEELATLSQTLRSLEGVSESEILLQVFVDKLPASFSF